jgi:multidrug efflux pump subunit AcrA (membrane-fusion protein)
MTNMNISAAFFASLLLAAGQAEAADQPGRLGNFVVTPIYDVRVPALEPGALIALDARKGDFVEEGQVLGRVDDSDALIRKAVAQNELDAAVAQAESDAQLLAAQATIGVAKAELEGSQRARSRVEDAVSEQEVRRHELTYKRSQYEAESAAVTHEVNQITRAMKLAQLGAVENEIVRRQITAPTSGVIADRFHNVGEWAQAGEPIYRLVHMDRLRVEGMLSASDLTPEEIAQHPDVKIYVDVPVTQQNPRGKIQIEGTWQIDFASQVVDDSGEFLISAEFDNPRKSIDGNHVQWAVRPGLDAEVELNDQLKTLLYQRRAQRRSLRTRSSLDYQRIRDARDR